MTSSTDHWVLTLVCHDRPGIVHAISGAILAGGGNITESHQYSSNDTGRFFMRLQVEAAGDVELDVARERCREAELTEAAHVFFAARGDPLEMPEHVSGELSKTKVAGEGLVGEATVDRVLHDRAHRLAIQALSEDLRAQLAGRSQHRPPSG